ncbi:MAG TPA: crosslink repair DNA glycosylase YcaQ family protein [Marmoricola sp.]|nr:crosslink repair DNA glycosylase YcaQ family protein [Marmoricola sp.]
MVHRLTREQARRIAVRAQLLDVPRPTGLLETVRHLAHLQIDLTAHVAPSADLVCWSRLGSAYSPADLDALRTEGSLVEFLGMLRPGEDIGLFRASMLAWPGPDPRDYQIAHSEWLRTNDACRQEILQVLRSEGPLPARDLPDTCVESWASSGWTNGRNVMKLLELMERGGEVAVSSREGRERLWDLAERVYPDSVVVPAEEARIARDHRRLAALGIARPRGPRCSIEGSDAGRAGEPAVVEGVRGTWQVDPRYLEDRPFAGRAALLSPLDRLVFDRKRMTDLFGFDYQLEMYKPEPKRKWGYWAMPILYGDRLVGKLDAEADHRGGCLRVHAVHEDEPFTSTMRGEVEQEIRDLATWLELELE